MKKLIKWKFSSGTTDTGGTMHGGVMIRDPDGPWVRYSDVQTYIKDLVEIISLDWNHQLISGGALLEEGSNDESKV